MIITIYLQTIKNKGVFYIHCHCIFNITLEIYRCSIAVIINIKFKKNFIFYKKNLTQ